MTARLLTIMGSGETAPTMVKVHRALLDRLDPPVPAVMLDTPFGFQENADDITARAVAYFADSVGATMEVARYRSADDKADSLAHEKAMARIREARYVFAGPGSPTYALRQWAWSAVPDILRQKLERGGCVTFASAAALTLGILTVPVYEIYKVGEPPGWRPGLDLAAAAGLRSVVIPHYNNAEGGHHDTRFCYLGERRLSAMEREMPDDAFVLGVDEHTGLILDLDAGEASVVGLGVVTLRHQGRSCELPTGAAVPIADLARIARGRGGGATQVAAPGDRQPADVVLSEVDTADPKGPAPRLSPLMESVRTRQDDFERAVAAGDADATVAAILGLDDDLTAWSADTLQSDELDQGRAALRSMVVRLGEVAGTGMANPRATVAPFVEAVIDLRARARSERRFQEADWARRVLEDAGVEVRDTPEGTEWDLR